jgi:hypothetical protein
MPDYKAALCHMQGEELVPTESVDLSATTDNEAVLKAVAWRPETVSNFDPNRRAWLMVLRDGKSIHCVEVG